jgi:hypothetical protein
MAPTGLKKLRRVATRLAFWGARGPAWALGLPISNPTAAITAITVFIHFSLS